MSETKLETAAGSKVRGTHGEYELAEKVATGGFGEVWRARTAQGEFVAIKFATSELGRRALDAEAEILGRIPRRVEATLPVVDRIAEPLALVMPWVKGRTLRVAFERYRTNDQRAFLCRWLIWLMEQVGQIHSLGIVHGDLKPENFLMGTTEPNNLEHDIGLWVIDFGLAHVVRKSRLDRSLSASLGTKELEGGTLAYLPPEAVKGAEPSFAGDVYALGVILHEVLLGRRPDKTEELSSLGLPEAVTDVLRKALAFDPEDRYANAGALARDLKQIESALTESGWRGRLRVLGRYAKAGLAAFFVTLRYLSVAVLLAGYVGILLGSIFGHPAVLFCILPFVALHVAIRWEGPETAAEASMRQSGGVVGWRKVKR